MFVGALGVPLVALADAPSARLLQNIRDEQSSLVFEMPRGASLHYSQDERYQPSAQNDFAIRSYWVPAETSHILTSLDGVPPVIEKFFVHHEDGQTWVKYLVHPESEDYYREFLSGAKFAGTLQATPTASSRTLLVWDEEARGLPPFFAKLSLDRNITNLVRTISREEVARSIGQDRILHANRAYLPENFAYMREVIGLSPKNMGRGGMIIRLVAPELEQFRVMPYYGFFKKEMNGELVIERMIRESGESPEAFLRERNFLPFVREWFELAVSIGETMNPHGQNLSAILDEHGLPMTRSLHKDLGDFTPDLKHMVKAGMWDPAQLPVITTLADDYRQTAWEEELHRSLDVYYRDHFAVQLNRRAFDRPDSLIGKMETLPSAIFDDAVIEVITKEYGVKVKNTGEYAFSFFSAVKKEQRRLQKRFAQEKCRVVMKRLESASI